jgi:3-methyladenine DNA glycosylase/8-oxoguanine DNA glycosylase
MRFALGVDDDLTEFARTFRGDPLIGEAIHHRPWHRPRRRPWAWEAFAWAVTEQLIEVSRAAEIQRRIVRRWGGRLEAAGKTEAASAAWLGPGPLRDVPGAAVVAGIAPAELESCDLAAKRAIALVKAAREIAAGRVDPADPAGDPRLMKISNIGPWTLQILGFCGRGEPDALPAGDLAYIKLVGALAGLGRRATVDEVEQYFAPYAPFRGLAGSFALVRWHGAVASGPPLPLAA